MSTARIRPATSGQSIFQTLMRFRGTILSLSLISGVVNVLYLSGSIFMLEVYDRVIPSRSLPTLAGLLLILVVLYLFQAVLEIIRSRVLLRLGSAATTGLGPDVLKLGASAALAGGSGAKPMQDMEQLRRFLYSSGPTALFDLPWMPIYLVICYAFHPLIGLTATAGALVLVALTFVSDRLTVHFANTGAAPTSQRDQVADMVHRNAEAVFAMGMLPRITRRWEQFSSAALSEQQQAADVTSTLGAVSKIMRMALQSIILAVGAYLVVQGQASAGVMIASSILTARALAPVEQAIANWRGLVAARQSWARLSAQLAHAATASAGVELPAPRRSLSVEALDSAPPLIAEPTIRGVTFNLLCGDGLGIVGQSGSGKSSLARALLGVWPTHAGKVRLDGAAIEHWSADDRGRHIGYLPQDVELFAGTVADNISRFEEDADSAKIIEAAQQASVHELILRLPQGYDTQIGDRGTALSAGTRQRIGLARALYGKPFLVVLDEPNSNLDAEGEAALGTALRRVRERGGIAVVIAHRPSALAELNRLLVMNNGRVHDFGPKEEVLARLAQPARPAPLEDGNHRDRLAS